MRSGPLGPSKRHTERTEVAKLGHIAEGIALRTKEVTLLGESGTAGTLHLNSGLDTFFFLFFSCGAEDGTRGFVHARQVLLSLS
jgi:hypothetical protein